MDYALPVSKRTRQQYDLKIIQQYNEYKEKKKKAGVIIASNTRDPDVEFIENLEKEEDDNDRPKKRMEFCNVLCQNLRHGEGDRVHSESIVEGSPEVRNAPEVGSASSVVGPVFPSVQKFGTADVDDSSSDEAEDVVFIPEAVFSDLVHSNCSSSKPLSPLGNGSKIISENNMSRLIIEPVETLIRPPCNGAKDRDAYVRSKYDAINVINIDSDSNSESFEKEVREEADEEKDEQEEDQVDVDVDDDDDDDDDDNEVTDNDSMDEDFQIIESHEPELDSCSSTDSEEYDSNYGAFEAECKNVGNPKSSKQVNSEVIIMDENDSGDGGHEETNSGNCGDRNSREEQTKKFGRVNIKRKDMRDRTIRIQPESGVSNSFTDDIVLKPLSRCTISHYPTQKRMKHGTFRLPFCVVDDGGVVEGKTNKCNDSDYNSSGDDFDGGNSCLTGTEDSMKYEAVTSLPLKFTFGIPKLKPTENLDCDSELVRLWEELDFVLRSCQIGSTGSPVMVCDTHDDVPDIGTNHVRFCSLGNHEYIIDEEIGLKCKYCSVVSLEIKNILPSFATNPNGKGKSGNHNNGRNEGDSFLDGVQSHGKESMGSDLLPPAVGTVWDLVPGIYPTMFPHQREGFEFIWKNVAGGIFLDKLKDCSNNNVDGGSGCIMSHAPGTGKTRLTIVFLQTYMKLFPMCRPVIIAPRSMLLTWEAEFKKWNFNIPFHNLNKHVLSGQETPTISCHQRRLSRTSMRNLKLLSWKKRKGVLGVSYRLFETLACERGRRIGRKSNKPGNEEVRQHMKKLLLELPGLVVFDEGHIPRNEDSLILKAVTKFKTGKRIILSGTPFQNNFKELYNTLCLVRPGFADKFQFEINRDHEKRGRKSRSDREKWAWCLNNSIARSYRTNNTNDSISCGRQLMELKDMIHPFVHVHKGSILQDNLPGLRNTVLLLEPSQEQKRLLKSVYDREKNPLIQENLVSLASVHPSLMPDWFVAAEEKKVVHPDAGVKLKFLMEFIRLSDALKEKVLVFSQYIHPLKFIKEKLKTHLGWIEGQEVLYMDGQLDARSRQSSINMFNEATNRAKVLLASTKACSEGISLVGASRVVLLDVVWNPSVRRQAISRAYRLGQKKMVHVYHLLTSGTMEADKYYRQNEKERVSELVFSNAVADGGNGEQQPVPSLIAEDKILEVMIQHEQLKSLFVKIINQPKASDLVGMSFGFLDDI